MNTWIDESGDDLWMILDQGTKVPSPPLAFGPPRFLFIHAGRLLEIQPIVWRNDSCWQIRDCGPAAQEG